MPISKNSIELEVKHYDRSTTKKQYKAIKHWLRTVRRQIDLKVSRIDSNAIGDFEVYGRSPLLEHDLPRAIAFNQAMKAVICQ